MEITPQERKVMDEQIYGMNTLVARDKAAANGWEIVYPEPNELFIDIDREEDYTTYQELLPIFQQYFQATEIRNTPSPSGNPGKRHIVLKLGEFVELSPIARLLLQACFGSDRKRELLGYMMYEIGGEQTPTLFFEKPEIINSSIPISDSDILF